MAGLSGFEGDPTRREVRRFGLWWIVFFAVVAAVAAWRPQGLVVGAGVLGAAWVASLVLNPEPRRRQLAGVLLPGLFGATGGAVLAGVRLQLVLAILGAAALGGALATWSSAAIGRRIYVGWMIAALPLGWSVSHLVLAAVYFLVLTPIGLVMRAAGRDPLHRRFERQARSYWVKRESKIPMSRYFRQF
jgi:hypothetical protein